MKANDILEAVKKKNRERTGVISAQIVENLGTIVAEYNKQDDVGVVISLCVRVGKGYADGEHCMTLVVSDFASALDVMVQEKNSSVELY